MRLLLLGALAIGCHGVEHVFLMRHCVRSIYNSMQHRGDPDFDSPNNYTARPFPPQNEWQAKGEAQCTARGLHLAELFGASLAARIPGPVAVFADNVTRCLDTAKRVAKGLGSKATIAGATPALDPVKNGVCKPLSVDERSGDVQEQLAFAEDPSSCIYEAWSRRSELLGELQELVGRGVAPSIANIPNKISDGIYVGGLQVAANGLVESFVLEAGAGLPVAWGKLDGANRSQLHAKWQQLNVLYQRINHGGTKISTRDGAVIGSILQQLEDTSSGSTLLVGHDTNLDAVASLAGLTWSCGPFADNTTPPMLGLLFAKSVAGVTVEVVCTPFDGDDSGSAVVGAVEMAGQKVSDTPVPLADWRRMLAGKLDFDCVAPVSAGVFVV